MTISSYDKLTSLLMHGYLGSKTPTSLVNFRAQARGHLCYLASFTNRKVMHDCYSTCRPAFKFPNETL